MTQERNEQTSSSSEQLNEQEVQTITGGCIGCSYIASRAKSYAETMKKEYEKEKYLPYNTLHDNFNALAERAKASTTDKTSPCAFAYIHRTAINTLESRIPNR